MEPVKFVALDRDDLEVVSTHLQDALVKVSDIMWRRQEKRLVLALDRFDWLAAGGTSPELRRCRAALRFERVTACKCRSVNPHGKDDILNLLAVELALFPALHAVPFLRRHRITLLRNVRWGRTARSRPIDSSGGARVFRGQASFPAAACDGRHVRGLA